MTPPEAKTERQIEERLREVIDAIPAYAWSMLPDGWVDFVNRRILDYNGLPAEDLLGLNWQLRVHPEDLEQFVSDWRASLASGEALEREIRLRRADGQYHWWLIRKVPQRNKSGEIVKWYGAGFDIEDKKRAEEAVLEQRVLERTRIARELHDTLLQSFQATLLHFEAVSKKLEPGEVKERLDRAISLAERAITEGRDAIQELRSCPPCVAQANDVAAALKLLGENLAASDTNPSSAVFHMEVKGMPVSLCPNVCREVFGICSEALRNAFRHGNAQRIQLEIGYDSEGFRLSVIDNGKGIEPNVLTKGGREGHFGLSSMRERAKLIGGKLTLWSEPDSGTKLELSIPTAHAYAVPDEK